MAREDVASETLRQIVDELKRTGSPVPYQSEAEARQDLSQEQLDAFSAFYSAVERYNQVAGDGEPQEGTPWWDGCLELRKQIQTAVEAGLIRFEFIQRLVFDFGALPDPEHGWKYYRLPNGFYACWECGTDILQKPVHNSVWIAEMRGCAGTGEVLTQLVPYCPICDTEPQNGVIIETVRESLARENQFVTAARKARQ